MKKLTKEDVIQLGMDYIQKNNVYPSSKKWTVKSAGCSRDVVLNLFDRSWKNFIKELNDYCEIPKPVREKWTKEKIIEKIRESAERNNGYPKYSDFDIKNPELPAAVTIRDKFVSWNNAVKASGFTVRATTKTNPIGELEEIVASLLTLHSYQWFRYQKTNQVNLLWG